MTAAGFWSYVRADDRAEGGRIVQLARDVKQQFEFLSGEEIELFLDVDGIGWGDDWRDKIDDRLAKAAFFIPVLTPRYFGGRGFAGRLSVIRRVAQQLSEPADRIMSYGNRFTSQLYEVDAGLRTIIEAWGWGWWRGGSPRCWRSVRNAGEAAASDVLVGSSRNPVISQTAEAI
jgi:hypothetical protein